MSKDIRRGVFFKGVVDERLSWLSEHYGMSRSALLSWFINVEYLRHHDTEQTYTPPQREGDGQQKGT